MINIDVSHVSQEVIDQAIAAGNGARAAGLQASAVPQTSGTTSGQVVQGADSTSVISIPVAVGEVNMDRASGVIKVLNNRRIQIDPVTLEEKPAEINIVRRQDGSLLLYSFNRSFVMPADSELAKAANKFALNPEEINAATLGGLAVANANFYARTQIAAAVRQ
jgi:hypothetical protein